MFVVPAHSVKHPEGLFIAEAATYLHNAQQTQETIIHAVSRIRTRDPSTREAAKLGLRQHGHRNRL